MGIWYYVAEPNAYLAVTGARIPTVKICKKCIVYPFQKVTKISITPFDFSMALQAMTSEKLQFSLPAVSKTLHTTWSFFPSRANLS